MASNAQIANMALLRVGQKTISGLDQTGSREANIVNTYFEPSRDVLLRVFPWNFARKRVALTEMVDTPPTNWGFVYALPADCLNALRITYPGDRSPRPAVQIPFEVANNGSQRVIYTDMEDAELEYTWKVVDPNLWDPAFIQVFAWLLAAEIALPLSGKADVANECRGAYMHALESAIAQNRAEGMNDIERAGDFLSARGMTL